MATLGEALKAVRTAAGLTQLSVAEAMTAKGAHTVQSQVSSWESGVYQPSFEQLAALEDCLRVPRGFVLARIGLVVATDVQRAIAADPRLDDDARQELLDAYQTATRRASRNARSRSRSGPR